MQFACLVCRHAYSDEKPKNVEHQMIPKALQHLSVSRKRNFWGFRCWLRCHVQSVWESNVPLHCSYHLLCLPALGHENWGLAIRQDNVRTWVVEARLWDVRQVLDVPWLETPFRMMAQNAHVKLHLSLHRWNSLRHSSFGSLLHQFEKLETAQTYPSFGQQLQPQIQVSCKPWKDVHCQQKFLKWCIFNCHC